MVKKGKAHHALVQFCSQWREKARMQVVQPLQKLRKTCDCLNSCDVFNSDLNPMAHIKVI